MNRTYNYDKFKEWLQLKKYSPATIKSIVARVDYFNHWAQRENISEPEEARYQDAVLFIAWCSKHGASQKTIANYLTHIRKFYQFLISEGTIKENPVAHIKVQGIKRKVLHDILTQEELQTLCNQYPTTIEYEAGKIIPPQEKNILSRKRNKAILSLLIYQGLRVEEVAALNIQDLQLREGKITIHSQRRTAARTMKLESHQVYELMDYIHGTRKSFLQAHGTTDKLFLQWRRSGNFHSITQMLLVHLRKINHRIKNIDQIRASVITAWLKQYDLRKVQYLAGHKYVSSTEDYKVNVIDELQDDVTKYHPL
ncbi:MAG: site-specific integrase [Arachidicoccus sp.]|nr:site-specific integrase [Arachidicoccus sp.]